MINIIHIIKVSLFFFKFAETKFFLLIKIFFLVLGKTFIVIYLFKQVNFK